MQSLENFLNQLNSIIWGEYVLIPLLSIVGIYLTIGLRAMPWRYIGVSFQLLFQGRKKDTSVDGDITPFQALMTALSATIGTGNIAGVATAIYFGGPGAIFWMWTIALFGMAGVFFFIFYSFPSALVLYWMFSNFFQLLQQSLEISLNV